MRRSLLVGIGVLLMMLAGASAALASAKGSRGPLSGHLRTSAGTSTSTNWSGYAAYGATFRNATGDWTQPTADCSSVPHNTSALAAFWVGLDGYLSNTVEQTGSEADCSAGSPLYYAWYEFYPHRLFILNPSIYPVAPNDSLSATVAQSAGRVTVTLADASEDWVFSTSTSARHLRFSSAEWIAEAPTNELTPFGTVDFSSASASTDGVTQHPIDAFTNDAITLETRNGIVRATPTPPPVSSSFSVTWQHL